MAHGGFLRQHSDDPELASHIMHDYTKADLDAETRGMLDFVTKLTKEPTNMSEADINGLRALGLSDEQILSVVLITCTFNFMTRSPLTSASLMFVGSLVNLVAKSNIPRVSASRSALV